MNINGLALLLSLLHAVTSPVPSSGYSVAAAVQPISVSFVDCSTFSWPHTLHAYVTENATGHEVMERAWHIVDTPIAVVRFKLPAGSYDVQLVSYPGCGDVFHLDVLPGRARSVTAIGAKGVPVDLLTSSVAGTLPFRGAIVSVVYDAQRRPSSNGVRDRILEIPAEVEGNAYYATVLPKGRARLRIYAPSRTHWVDIDLGMIDPYNPAKRTLRMNVTPQEVREAMARAMHPKQVFVNETPDPVVSR